MSSLADRIEARLRRTGRRSGLRSERAYLKSDLEFLGATVWQTRARHEGARAAARPRRARAGGHRALVGADVRAAHGGGVPARGATPASCQRRRPPAASNGSSASRRRGPSSTGWPATPRQARGADPDGMTPTLDRWAADDDFWVRRASLLAELRPIRTGRHSIDSSLAQTPCLTSGSSSSARRSAGCCARPASDGRTRSTAWLAPRTDRASGVTMREAVKYLPADVAARLMDAYRGEAPGRLKYRGVPRSGARCVRAPTGPARHRGTAAADVLFTDVDTHS